MSWFGFWRAIQVFQSPLHRGRVFNLRNSRVGTSVQDFQSPLHRGRVFNSCSHRPLPPYKPLSVPSSSGKGLQRSQPRWCWPPPAVTFSPLFIGEGSSTNSRWIPRFASMSFQSPLHRGRVFNKRWYHWLVPSLFLSVPSSSGKGLQRSPRWAARCGKESLSVPSSSGKGLQRDQRLAAQPRQEAFSPLFIGEGSSTPVTRTFSEAAGELSVPSSSGKGLQPAPGAAGAHPPAAFSPLFIGEGSSTIHILIAQRDGFAFQSPLHRGRVFNWSAIRWAAKKRSTFSPLFIGEGSSTRPSLRCAGRALPAFSPLFIGEGSST